MIKEKVAIGLVNSRVKIHITDPDDLRRITEHGKTMKIFKLILATDVVLLMQLLSTTRMANDYEAVSAMHFNTYTVPANAESILQNI
jgi:hypothetical protein